MHESTDTLEQYRAHRRRREEETRRAQRRGRTVAWKTARRAAAWLKQAGAARVVLFGSMASDEHLSPRSGVDLAVWGLEPSAYFGAVARLQDIGSGLRIDLIRMEQCPPSLRDRIVQEGIDL